jgi:uncharacterized protein (TIGR00661 family)
LPKTVLYAVLHWGLGHASRSIPIIQALLEQNHKLVIASDGEALQLLQKTFPTLLFETLPAYQIQYSKKAEYFDLKLFTQAFHIQKTIQKEHQHTLYLIKKHNISHIISDNRYGVYASSIPSVIICHQLTLQHKNLLKKQFLNFIHRSLLKPFQQIWVPDFPNMPHLAGDISFSTHKVIAQKCRFILPQSHLSNKMVPMRYDIIIVLSGPEPQRSILEKKLYSAALTSPLRIVLVRGISKPIENLKQTEQLSIFNLLDSNALSNLILASKLFIGRSGYSSIMDLVYLQKKAILIPTPGQTEQMYLAKYVEEKTWFYTVNQANFEWENSLAKVENYTPPVFESANTLLDNTIKTFLA